MNLDERTADLLLDGKVDLEDLNGLTPIATLIRLVKTGTQPDDNFWEPDGLRSFQAAVLASPTPIRSRKRHLGAPKWAVTAASLATLAVGSTAAAAATNSLPAPIQREAHHLAADVGISLPAPTTPVTPAGHIHLRLTTGGTVQPGGAGPVTGSSKTSGVAPAGSVPATASGGRVNSSPVTDPARSTGGGNGGTTPSTVPDTAPVVTIQPGKPPTPPTPTTTLPPQASKGHKKPVTPPGKKTDLPPQATSR